MITRDILSSHRWQFERSDGAIIATIGFREDGTFDRPISSNECAWRLGEDGLAFLDATGAVSTLFRGGRLDAGRHVLEGDFLPLRAPGHHRLVSRDIRLTEQQLRARVPEVFRLDGHYLWIRTTARVIATLAELKIFFGRLDNRFSETDLILVPRARCLEPYCCFPVGSRLHAMGAFSYAESALEDVPVGRYCSIAMGVQVFRDRHPIEWVSSSSLPYDAHATTGYRSFVQARADFGLDGFPLTRPADAYGPPPRLEHDVWIGQNVQLARDITIGTGAVIAAGAVVTKDVAP